MSPSRENQKWLDDLCSRSPSIRDQATADLQQKLRRNISAQFIRRGLNTSCVDDIVQEASLRIFNRLDTFRGESQFETWATAVAVRTGLEMIRRGFWETKTTSDLFDGQDIDLVNQWQTTSPGPQASAEQQEVLKVLEDAINHSLTDRQKCALMGELQGKSTTAIAEEMEITRGAVYKLTHDARKKLRRVLEDAGFNRDVVKSLFSN